MGAARAWVATGAEVPSRGNAWEGERSRGLAFVRDESSVFPYGMIANLRVKFAYSS